MKRFYRGAMLMSLVLASVFYMVEIAKALDPKTFEIFGVQQHYHGRVPNVASTHTVTGQMISYDVKVVGGTGDFTIKHSTWLGAGYAMTVSSTIYLSSGASFGESARGLMFNPLISIDRLDTNTTAYVNITYFQPRGNGAP